MSLSVVFVVVSALWMIVLTLVTLGLVRQIGLVTVRLDRSREASAPINDGLGIGDPVPPEILNELAVDRDAVGYLLILGAVCEPCRELASDLRERSLPRPLSALVSGRKELASAIAELLPPDVAIVLDDDEGKLARAMRIETTPFAFEIVEGHVRGKAILRGVDHLLSFMQSAEQHVNGDAEEALLQIEEVNVHAQP